MINKRLIKEMKTSFNYALYVVGLNWLTLITSISIIVTLANFINELYINRKVDNLAIQIIIVVIALLIRFTSIHLAAHFSDKSAAIVKLDLRKHLHEKLAKLGANYNQYIKTSELTQLASDGVEQLEIYVSAYIPKLFYGLLAPVSLFIFLLFIDIKVAIILLLCVPLIPLAIVMVMKTAKKILAKYFDLYYNLGDSFLDNLQGLTVLKIFNHDEKAHEEMNKDAEDFRRITMKVLTMQLGSITIMDLVAFGGAASAIVFALLSLQNETITIANCLIIILISSEFFIPLRALGSTFHTAMNGAVAIERMFDFLDIPTREQIAFQDHNIENNSPLQLKDINFTYAQTITDKNNDVEILPTLQAVSMTFPGKSVTAIVGESGSGKSTIAQVLMGWLVQATGVVLLGETDIRTINPTTFYNQINLIPTQSYLFTTSIRENLLLGNQKATDEQIWEVLQLLGLAEFVAALPTGLDFILKENGKNISGGQRQRLSVARSLLLNSPIYIFDEATSSVDAETEKIIINLLYKLSATKTIILISHNLINVKNAQNIYVMQNGSVEACGIHQELLVQNPWYKKAYGEQSQLENNKLLTKAGVK
jgi:ABC-type transport system involved in cytochrome bd biosynthesis, ATPase and permease components